MVLFSACYNNIQTCSHVRPWCLLAARGVTRDVGGRPGEQKAIYVHEESALLHKKAA